MPNNDLGKEVKGRGVKDEIKIAPGGFSPLYPLPLLLSFALSCNGVEDEGESAPGLRAVLWAEAEEDYASFSNLYFNQRSIAFKQITSE